MELSREAKREAKVSKKYKAGNEPGDEYKIALLKKVAQKYKAYVQSFDN